MILIGFSLSARIACCEHLKLSMQLPQFAVKPAAKTGSVEGVHLQVYISDSWERRAADESIAHSVCNCRYTELAKEGTGELQKGGASSYHKMQSTKLSSALQTMRQACAQ